MLGTYRLGQIGNDGGPRSSSGKVTFDGAGKGTVNALHDYGDTTSDSFRYSLGANWF